MFIWSPVSISTVTKHSDLKLVDQRIAEMLDLKISNTIQSIFSDHRWHLSKPDLRLLQFVKDVEAAPSKLFLARLQSKLSFARMAKVALYKHAATILLDPKPSEVEASQVLPAAEASALL